MFLNVRVKVFLKEKIVLKVFYKYSWLICFLWEGVLLNMGDQVEVIEFVNILFFKNIYIEK